VTAQKALAAQCEKCLTNLPEAPTGVVLSKQGAIEAVLAAAAHFASEMSRWAGSRKSSTFPLTSTKKLKG